MGKWTWLTPYVEAWKAKTGTPPNCKRLAMELGIVKRSESGPKEKVEAKMLAYWKEYVKETPAKYLSPTRFRETFKHWDPTIRQRVRIDKQLDAEQRQKARDNREEQARREGKMTRLSDIIELPGMHNG